MLTIPRPQIPQGLSCRRHLAGLVPCSTIRNNKQEQLRVLLLGQTPSTCRIPCSLQQPLLGPELFALVYVSRADAPAQEYK